MNPLESSTNERPFEALFLILHYVISSRQIQTGYAFLSVGVAIADRHREPQPKAPGLEIIIS